jgi:hypothetical protein
MMFTKRLREGVRRGEITCSVRIWMRPHVAVGVLTLVERCRRTVPVPHSSPKSSLRSVQRFSRTFKLMVERAKFGLLKRKFFGIGKRHPEFFPKAWLMSFPHEDYK